MGLVLTAQRVVCLATGDGRSCDRTLVFRAALSPTESEGSEHSTMSASVLSLLLLLCSLHCSDGFQNYMMSRCLFNSSELKDIEYVQSYYYNKLEVIRFSSSVGKYEGYTELGVKNAENWNKDAGLLARMNAEKERYCKNHVDNRYQYTFPYSVTPHVVLSSETPSGGRHPSMLVCSVYSFYPKHIKVTWTRDQDPVTSDITSTEELADGDWYYQVHSHLEYTPRSGEKISCVVEHVSLKEPLITDWDASMPESQRNKIAIGASGLILGLVLSLAGFIYYKRKSRGRILVPTN